jgi:hypothetical protein
VHIIHDFLGYRETQPGEPRGVTLCCFSPPVMLATMVVEGVLAIYVLAKYRHGMFAKMAVLLIVLLGVFQLSEYQVCGNQNPQFWSRLGLVITTLLPIAGLQLISFVTQKRHFLAIGYAVGAALALVVIFVPQGVTGAFCGGNFIVFNGSAGLYEFYGAYYFAFLIFAIWESLEAMHENKGRMIRRVLRWFVIGYLSFMVPMGIVYAIYAPARAAMTSIMCGFAVILAFIVAFQIVPEYYQYRYGRKAD